jgi:hypothetical protein
VNGLTGVCVPKPVEPNNGLAISDSSVFFTSVVGGAILKKLGLSSFLSSSGLVLAVFAVFKIDIEGSSVLGGAASFVSVVDGFSLLNSIVGAVFVGVFSMFVSVLSVGFVSSISSLFFNGSVVVGVGVGVGVFAGSSGFFNDPNKLEVLDAGWILPNEKGAVSDFFITSSVPVLLNVKGEVEEALVLMPSDGNSPVAGGSLDFTFSFWIVSGFFVKSGVSLLFGSVIKETAGFAETGLVLLVFKLKENDGDGVTVGVDKFELKLILLSESVLLAGLFKLNNDCLLDNSGGLTTGVAFVGDTSLLEIKLDKFFCVETVWGRLNKEDPDFSNGLAVVGEQTLKLDRLPLFVDGGWTLLVK